MSNFKIATLTVEQIIEKENPQIQEAIGRYNEFGYIEDKYQELGLDSRQTRIAIDDLLYRYTNYYLAEGFEPFQATFEALQEAVVIGYWLRHDDILFKRKMDGGYKK